ncbi:MAG TPA: hypothetical protein VHN59_14360 [Chitinophagaceae bacterium]|nr:hypothetical protein [Chitinophagaceae bacterium]
MLHLQSMKKKESIPEMAKKVSIRYNKGLNKYENQVLFPEKVAHMNRLLKGVKLPSDGASSSRG